MQPSVRAREVDDEGVEDLVERQHGAVDLAGPHPDAPRLIVASERP